MGWNAAALRGLEVEAEADHEVRVVHGAVDIPASDRVAAFHAQAQQARQAKVEAAGDVERASGDAARRDAHNTLADRSKVAVEDGNPTTPAGIERHTMSGTEPLAHAWREEHRAAGVSRDCSGVDHATGAPR